MDFLEQYLFGIIAIIMGYFSLGMRRGKKMMMGQFAVSGSFCLFYILNTMVSMFGFNAISALRNIVYANKDKKIFRSKIYIYVFCVMYIVAGLVFWKILDVRTVPFIVVGLIISTFGFRMHKTRNILLSVLVAAPFMMTYYYLNGIETGLVYECVIVITAALNLFRMRKQNKNHR